MNYKTEYIKLELEGVQSFPGNPQIVTEERMKMMSDQMKKHGWYGQAPLVWYCYDEGNYYWISGHHRAEAATRAGITHRECEVIVDSSYTWEKAKKDLLMYNNIHGDPDEELEAEIVEQILEFEENISEIADSIGRSIDEVIGMMDKKNLEELSVEDDDIPEPPVDVFTVNGDIFILKGHVIKCGDSTNKDDVAHLMGGNTADIVFTSPPYNAGQTPTEIKMGLKSKYKNDDDDKSKDEYLGMLNDFMFNYLNIVDYIFLNVQSLAGNKEALITLLHLFSDRYADTIIWDKGRSQPAMAENVLNSRFEYIHIFSEKATRHIGVKKFRGTIDNVFELDPVKNKDKDKDKSCHATFPVVLPMSFLNYFSLQSCVDPFIGTGSTLIAAHRLGRKCYGMEIDPYHIDVTVQRFLNIFGINDCFHIRDGKKEILRLSEWQ